MLASRNTEGRELSICETFMKFIFQMRNRKQ